MPYIDTDLDWLHHANPIGLVIAPRVLQDLDLVPQRQGPTDTAEAAIAIDKGLPDFWPLAEMLGWPASRVAGAPGGLPLEQAPRVHLTESGTLLEPHYAVQLPDASGWQLLVRHEAHGIDADKRGALPGWEATPHQRFERLLRETSIGAGLLITDTAIRLIVAPRGETSGWLTFPLDALQQVPGRALLGGLKLLLGPTRLFTDAPDRRLPALLAESRRAQAAVSTALAGQVLGALHELLRGLHAAEPELIAELARNRQGHLYEGLLAVLMRLVFLLYAEDRDLIPSRSDAESRAFYDQGYGVRTLHTKLLNDQARTPDTMDERRGAWGRLLALFRLVHAGCGTGWMRGRGGKLFDPQTFPFLLGQSAPTDSVRIPPVGDGCILRVLDGLMVLSGERLSYRALDVEQIGSVYETVMGFTVVPAPGASLAIRAGKRDRTPVFVDLPALFASRERVKWLKENTDRGKFPAAVERAIRAASTERALASALAAIVDPRGSPHGHVWPIGTPLLQPTDERRRTGSHYTPRDLTNPIVAQALAPAFARIGQGATPDQVLALKVCDPAMGSGAFLVEACRQIAARLVDSWSVHHGTRPPIPADEDEELLARRLVAQRCLYGVDRNPMATDLARLSLWLATLARDHEFTFLDHALRTGDSLVGLTNDQVTRLDWRQEAQGSLFGSLVRDRLSAAMALRKEIRLARDDVTLLEQERRLASAEESLADLRLAGDAVIAAHFSSARDRARGQAVERMRDTATSTAALWATLRESAAMLTTGEHPLRPFHWGLEFPEVFAPAASGPTDGFDAIVGNPPFLGGKRISTILGIQYQAWLHTLHSAPGGADLVAHFFRRAFSFLNVGGCLGLIATNTLSQGETREGGLEWLLKNDGRILRTTRRIPWPGDAAVVVSVVHVHRGQVPNVVPILDGRRVSRISAYLVEGDLDAPPFSLAANAGIAFNGCFTMGFGFTFDDEAFARGKPASPIADISRLIEEDSNNAARILPFLGSEEVNAHPGHFHRRWVIDFVDYPLGRRAIEPSWAAMSSRERAGCRATGFVPADYQDPVAEDWPALLEVLRRLVLPERERKTGASRDAPWWLFFRPRPAMRTATAGLPHFFVTGAAMVTHHVFAKLKAPVIPSHKLAVIATADPAIFGQLQSSVHEVWSAAFGATAGSSDAITYNPKHVFLTFAFADPESTTLVSNAANSYLDGRAKIMKEVNQGLTSIYTRYHREQDRTTFIDELRKLHRNLDRAVLLSYGWDDLAKRANPVFLTEINEPEYRFQNRLFWPASFRDEVLSRLLALNARRAAGEAAAGLTPAIPADDVDTEADYLADADA